MKHYNKKNCLHGLAMALFGGGMFAMSKANFYGRELILLSLLCMVFGIGLIIRGLSPKCVAADEIEEKDEKKQLVLLKNRSAAFVIHRYCCLALTALLLLAGKAMKADVLVFIGLGLAVSFGLSIILDIATFIYYESHE